MQKTELNKGDAVIYKVGKFDYVGKYNEVIVEINFKNKKVEYHEILFPLGKGEYSRLWVPIKSKNLKHLTTIVK